MAKRKNAAALEARMMKLKKTFTARFDLPMGRRIELEKELHKPR